MTRGRVRRVFRRNGGVEQAEQARADAERRYRQALERRPKVQRAADTLETLIQRAIQGGA